MLLIHLMGKRILNINELNKKLHKDILSQEKLSFHF